MLSSVCLQNAYRAELCPLCICDPALIATSRAVTSNHMCLSSVCSLTSLQLKLNNSTATSNISKGCSRWLFYLLSRAKRHCDYCLMVLCLSVVRQSQYLQLSNLYKSRSLCSKCPSQSHLCRRTKLRSRTLMRSASLLSVSQTKKVQRLFYVLCLCSLVTESRS